MLFQHVITKQIDATETRRYFFRNGGALLKPEKNPFRNTKRVQFRLTIEETRYDFRYEYKQGKTDPFFFIDVPDAGKPSQLDYCFVNDKGHPIPPYKQIELSDAFENLHEKLLTLPGEDTEAC